MIRPNVTALLVFLTCCFTACGEQEIETAAPDEPPAPLTADESGSVDTRAVRDRFVTDFERYYNEYLATQLAPQPLRYVLLADDPSVRIVRQRFLAGIYDDRDFAHVFVTGAGLTPRAEAVVRAAELSGTHALNQELYFRDSLVEALDDYAQWRAAYLVRPTLEGVEGLQDAVEELLADDAVRGVEDIGAALMSALLEHDDPSSAPLPQLARAHETRLSLERAYRGQAAILEALIADVFLAYAFDQRHFNLSSMPDSASDEERNGVIAERLRTSFEAMTAATDAESADEVIRSVEPHYPQYDGLYAERQRYAAIVEAGGWEEIDRIHLERGHEHPRVQDLKERLAIEGYFDGEINETFDEALERGVEAYQQTHQMEVTGETSRSFWNSVNIPADYRLAQIELAMGRWRETRIGDDEYYVFVNIPDFHGEVWRDGERQRRFRVVTGNTTRVCNERTGEWEYANATPQLSAMMSYVVMNPYWNVPRRIVEEELLPALLEDELYFEENGFERHTTEDGYEVIRQLPGEANPLGRVKFMFPNPHNVYLHDTSRPQLFRYPIRAFSHGCMRVQDPLELLELLMTNDGQWDERDFTRALESGEETAIRLREAVPVHVEYYVTRVDDEGRANFLADIYRLDRDRLDPPTDRERSCTPEPEPEMRLVLTEELTVMFEDGEGNLVDPNAELPADGLNPDGTPIEGAGDGTDGGDAAADVVPPAEAAGDIGP